MCMIKHHGLALTVIMSKGLFYALGDDLVKKKKKGTKAPAFIELLFSEGDRETK